MTVLQVAEAVIISSVCLSPFIISRSHCGHCHKRIYLWQSRAYHSTFRRNGWFHARCGGTSVLGALMRVAR